jgi:hypothetical protein
MTEAAALDPVTLAILAGVAVLTLTGVLALALAAGWRPLRKRPAVIVALRTGETVRGVLVGRRPTYLQLARVEVLHGGGGASSTIDGTLEIDRDNVTWVQVP